MQIHIRLPEVLRTYNDTGRGLIKRICDYTGLERHQVAALLSGRVRQIPLQTLAAICGYLVERHHVDPAQLPGMLFALEPSQLDSLMASRRHVRMCVGVRSDPVTAGIPMAEHRWVMACDSYLQAVLLTDLFGSSSPNRWQGQPQFLQQVHVTALDKELTRLDQARAEAEDVYREFRSLPGDAALICIGSIKSNCVVELVQANLFGVRAFVSQDGLSSPRERACPVYFRVRDGDPQPPACHAGLRLARSRRSTTPGIYYEADDGSWQCCPSSRQRDGAIVLVVYRPLTRHLEVVMGGFSGRATRCLASALTNLAPQLWPASYRHPELEVSLSVIDFQFDGSASSAGLSEAQRAHVPSQVSVTRIANQVLARRLDRTHAREQRQVVRGPVG